MSPSWGRQRVHDDRCRVPRQAPRGRWSQRSRACCSPSPHAGPWRAPTRPRPTFHRSSPRGRPQFRDHQRGRVLLRRRQLRQLSNGPPLAGNQPTPTCVDSPAERHLAHRHQRRGSAHVRLTRDAKSPLSGDWRGAPRRRPSRPRVPGDTSSRGNVDRASRHDVHRRLAREHHTCGLAGNESYDRVGNGSRRWQTTNRSQRLRLPLGRNPSRLITGDRTMTTPTGSSACRQEL